MNFAICAMVKSRHSSLQERKRTKCESKKRAKQTHKYNHNERRRNHFGWVFFTLNAIFNSTDVPKWESVRKFLLLGINTTTSTLWLLFQKCPTQKKSFINNNNNKNHNYRFTTERKKPLRFTRAKNKNNDSINEIKSELGFDLRLIIRRKITNKQK